MNYKFVAKIKTLDYVSDVIRWLCSIGCDAWQDGCSWWILATVPKDKVNEVMNAYNNNFGW